MADNLKSIAETNKKPDSKYRRWNTEIVKAEKALEEWHKRADKINKRYLDERDTIAQDERRFNIFTANTEIMMASLYSKIPKVDVSRRFEQFMDKQGPAFAAEVLGKGRYEFYKASKLTLSQLIDPRSLEPLTLAELRDKFG